MGLKFGLKGCNAESCVSETESVEGPVFYESIYYSDLLLGLVAPSAGYSYGWMHFLSMKSRQLIIFHCCYCLLFK